VSRWKRFTGQQLVVLAGFALIALGIVCLYLSDAVVTGWWQGTLDAFGVGFIVGGLVDVIAISGLNQAIIAINVQQGRRQEANSEAEAMLRKPIRPVNRDDVDAIRDILRRSGSLLDPSLRRQLELRMTRISNIEKAMERQRIIAAEQQRTLDRSPPSIKSRISQWWNS
jgi:hypothetical protein